jgi:hypothetical protein
MNAVVADRTVDDTSRKVARHHLGRDKGDESRQHTDILIIRDSCSA